MSWPALGGPVLIGSRHPRPSPSAGLAGGAGVQIEQRSGADFDQPVEPKLGNDLVRMGPFPSRAGLL